MSHALWLNETGPTSLTRADWAEVHRLRAILGDERFVAIQQHVWTAYSGVESLDAPVPASYVHAWLELLDALRAEVRD